MVGEREEGKWGVHGGTGALYVSEGCGATLAGGREIAKGLGGCRRLGMDLVSVDAISFSPAPAAEPEPSYTSAPSLMQLFVRS